MVSFDYSDEDQPVEYLPRDEPSRNQAHDLNFAWFFTETLKVPRWDGWDVSVTNNGEGTATVALGTAPASPTFTTLVGEYIKIGMEPGYYKITAENATFDSLTISPKYYGPSIDGNQGDSKSHWSIRPAKTRKVTVYDNDLDFDDDAETTMYYSEFPPPLYNEHQEILLPTTELLIEASLSVLAGSQSSRREHQSNFEELLAEAIRLNPSPLTPRVPKGIHGKAFDMTSTEMYSDRDENHRNTVRLVEG